MTIWTTIPNAPSSLSELLEALRITTFFPCVFPTPESVRNVQTQTCQWDECLHPLLHTHIALPCSVFSTSYGLGVTWGWWNSYLPVGCCRKAVKRWQIPLPLSPTEGWAGDPCPSTSNEAVKGISEILQRWWINFPQIKPRSFMPPLTKSSAFQSWHFWGDLAVAFWQRWHRRAK